MSRPNDTDALLDTLLKFAQSMLQKHGEFHPFGATMSSNGDVTLAATSNDETEKSEVKASIELLTERMKEEAASGKIRAAGICYDALVVPPGMTTKVDAACCLLDDTSGDSSEIYLPYQKRADGIRYGELFGARKDPWLSNR